MDPRFWFSALSGEQRMDGTCMVEFTNIDQAVDTLTSKGVTFERFDNLTDDRGIACGIATQQGPDIAWFKGNILSVLQER